MIALLSASGARNTEACDLRWSDLDFTHGKINVARSKTRRGVREIDMIPWLREELLNLVYEVGPQGVRVIDRGKVHQDHAVAVRGVVASLAHQPCGWLVIAKQYLDEARQHRPHQEPQSQWPVARRA